jgi:lipoprotein-releasing system permease protein
VYLELDAARDFLGMKQDVSGIEVRVDEPEQVERVTPLVYAAIGKWPYRTVDWREMNAGIFAALRVQKIMFFLLLTFIVIVAAFNIASTLFMVVLEKSHEIAILKSLGARDSSIMKIFVYQGFLVGGLGTTLGVLLGLGLCELVSRLEIQIAPDVYWVERLTVDVQPLEVALVAVAAIIISHLATLQPALRAARLPPVEAMRLE